MPLSRRFFLGSLAAARLAAADKKKKAPEHPGVVLILGHNVGAWMLGCYGNPDIHTPHIDRLARTGTRLVNHSTCSPSAPSGRASLLTGRTPLQHGILNSATPPPPFFRDELLLSDILAGAGYDCGYAGQWDLGGGGQPQHHYGFWQTAPGDPAAVTASASQFLDRQSAGKPFFLTVSYFDPRPPYDYAAKEYAQATFEKMGRDAPAASAAAGGEFLRDIVPNLRRYAAGITSVDAQVQALVDKLTARGLLDNTLVVFTSPSGGLIGRHGLWADGEGSQPFNMYQEALGVPMIWSWLGHVPAENTRPEIVDTCDFVPALCEAAGVPPPDRNLSGRSYFPLVANRTLPKKSPWRNQSFADLGDTGMARDARYKVVVRKGAPGELYDLTVDPGEKANRYDDPHYVVVRDGLSAALAAWRKQYGR